MGKFTATQNNFSSGELSPTLEGRSDLKEYSNGVSELSNFIPLKDGGIQRRSGTKIYPKNTIIAEDGAFFAHEGDISGRRFFSLTVKYVTGDALGTVECHSHSTSNTGNSLQDLTVVQSPVTSFVTDRFKEIVKAFPFLDYRTWNSIQIFDAIILTHPSGLLPTLIIAKSTNFELHEYLPYAAIQQSEGRALAFPSFDTSSTNVEQVTITGGGTIATFTSNITNPDRKIGDYIKVLNGGNEFIYRITAELFVNAFTITPVVNSAGDVAATTNWVYSSWSHELGFPRSCSIYQQRVCFGGTDNEPSVVWFSNVENLFLLINNKLPQDSASDISGLDYFGVDIASDPFSVTMASNITTTITWMNSDRVLQVGTGTAEYVISPIDGVFDRSHVDISAQTFYGSRGGATVRAQNEVLFASRNGKEIRANRFAFQNGGNTSRLMSVLSREMVYHNLNDTSRYDSVFTKSVYQTSRGTVWIITGHGSLIGLTLEESSGTLAWHKHNLGNDGKVIGMCVLPTSEGNSDALFLNVERLDPAGDIYYSTEMLLDEYAYDTVVGEAEKAVFLDASSCLIPFPDGELRYLEIKGYKTGQFLTVFYDGIDYGEHEILAANGGSILLPFSELSIDTCVTIGFKYKSKTTSMLVKTGSKTGDAQIQMSRIDSLAVNTYKSKHYKLGTHDNGLQDVVLTADDDVNLFTGIINKSPSSKGGREQRFTIETEKPFPLTILSVGVRGETQD